MSSLFENVSGSPLSSIPSGKPLSRKALIKRAFEKADAAFLARYEQCVKVYGEIHETFVAADVTAWFEAKHGKIAERNAKGLGHLFAQLQVRRVIEKTGEMKPRKNGNVAAEYRLKVEDQNK